MFVNVRIRIFIRQKVLELLKLSFYNDIFRKLLNTVPFFGL